MNDKQDWAHLGQFFIEIVSLILFVLQLIFGICFVIPRDSLLN